MKSIWSLLLAGCMVFVLTACASTPAPEECIDDISSVTEDGEAYYDVYWADDVDWNALPDSAQRDISIYAINECIGLAQHTTADSYSVMGFDSDGNITFSWGGIDGTTEVRYYEEGVYSHNYGLLEGDLEY